MLLPTGYNQSFTGSVCIVMAKFFTGGHAFDRVAQWIRRLPTEQEILGSIPSMVDRVNLAEWLRRQTRNLLGFPRAGSNPAVDVLSLEQMHLTERYHFFRSGRFSSSMFPHEENPFLLLQHPYKLEFCALN